MLVPLDMLKAGEWAEVASVSGDASWVGRLAELGVREGSRVCLLQPGTTCLLQVGGCKLCLRGQESANIFVHPVAGP